MICEYCHGAGKIKTIKLISAEQGFDCVEEVCTKCNGSGEKEQTNFDRITQSPESLAEWIEELEYGGNFCVRCCPKYCECDNTQCKEMMVEWLKQESDTE